MDSTIRPVQQAFESGKTDALSEAKKGKDKLLKAISQLKVKNDFLPVGS